MGSSTKEVVEALLGKARVKHREIRELKLRLHTLEIEAQKLEDIANVIQNKGIVSTQKLKKTKADRINAALDADQN